MFDENFDENSGSMTHRMSSHALGKALSDLVQPG